MIGCTSRDAWGFVLFVLEYCTAVWCLAADTQTNKQTNNNDLLEKDVGTNNCIYKD